MGSLKLFLGILFIFVVGCADNPPPKSEPIEDPKRKIHEEAKLQALAKHDQAFLIKEGWIRDPYIYLAPDGFYYLTGTTPAYGDPREQTELYNTGLDKQNQELYGTPSIVGPDINVWRSTNLLDWEYVGAPFSLDKGYWASEFAAEFQPPRKDWRLWAPELYAYEGRWIFVHTSPAPVKGGANLAITVGEELQGPFSFPMKTDIRNKHDPSLFKEGHTWYLLWGNTYIAALLPGFEGIQGEPKRIDPANRKIGHEGATLRKIGDKYVHFGTAWSTDKMRKGSYNLYYCLSDSIMGPYGPRRFVGRFLGHGTPFQDKEGRWWCTAFYNGNIPPLSKEGIREKDLGETAQTINGQGTTLVPLEVRIEEDGDVYIRAKDPNYAFPGPDEAQVFE
ncbi:MAG: family 43 glycosylhydrolase [Bacteroidota bacterium]